LYESTKRGKVNRESIPVHKDQNDKLVTDQIEKSTSLNTFYASLFSWELNNPQIQSTESGKTFTIIINIMRKLLSTTEKKKTVGNFKVSLGSHDWISSRDCWILWWIIMLSHVSE